MWRIRQSKEKDDNLEKASRQIELLKKLWHDRIIWLTGNATSRTTSFTKERKQI
jgi:hypothetical protein